MPGSIRSMQLEHVLRNVQTDRGSLLHGRLLRWQFDTVTLAHRMPSGGVHPITQLSGSPRLLRTAGTGQNQSILRGKDEGFRLKYGNLPAASLGFPVRFGV